MIKANFNAYDNYVTDSVHQWDLNRILSVSGLNLSVAPEVRFSNSNMDRAIARQAVLESYIVSVQIPNSLLQDPLPIKADIGVYEGSTFKVVETILIPVIPTKRPADYIIENSDEELYSFEALKNAIANMVKLSEFNKTDKVLNARIDTIIANNTDTEGNSELVDIRVGYDGKTYRSGGAATRNQNEDIVKTLTRSGLYSEIVLTGEDKPGYYAVKDSGKVKENEYSNRGVVIYDVSSYAGKSIQISTSANSDTMFAWIITDVDGNTLKTVSGSMDYKEIEVLPSNAHYVYVNYAISEAENSNVLVKALETFILPDTFDKLTADLENTNSKLDTLAKTGDLHLSLPWEMGGISTTGEIYSPDDYRIRTSEYYRSNFGLINFIVPDGYRMLAVFYTYSEDTGEYVYSRHRGYVTGAGTFPIYDGEYIRFVLRGVSQITFTGDEYKLLSLYHKAEAFVTRGEVATMIEEYHPDTIPDYWVDTLATKEKEIKDIIYSGVSADNDIATFFTVADPHYPDNTEISTSLMKYLSEKCGINLTVCLGDLIADSKNSRDEGLERIHNGMSNLANMSDRMILTQGNHDTNIQITNDEGQISAERIVYDKEWILHTSSKLLGLNKIVFDDLGKAFYYDDDVLKIRFISIDSFEGKTYEIKDGILTALHLGRATDRQITWLRDVALKNIPDNYSVITFSHLAMFSPKVSNGSGFISLNVGAMGNGENVLAVIRQFITDGGDYIGHFAGHLHHDFISNNDGVISVHSLNDGTHWRAGSYFGDNADLVGDSPLKTTGTITECAFDAVIVNKTTRHVDLIRIGAGNNRHFDY